MNTNGERLHEKRHPIEVAARRSGLTKDVLRAWERRYGVVSPGRTDTGRRLYSDRDVERLTLLGRATAGGRPISLVAKAATEDLEAMVQQDAALGSAPKARNGAGRVSSGQDHVDACLEAIQRTDQDAVRRTLRRAVIALPSTALIEDVVAPLMVRVGELWLERRLDPGQERLASNAAREVLGDMIAAFQDSARAGPRLLVATPSRQRHELGSMLAAATASALGWHVTYLGADIPVEDIVRAAAVVGADALALSLMFPEDDPELPDDLRRLRSLVPDIQIVVGGRAMAAYSQVLQEIGARMVADLAEFRSELSAFAQEQRWPTPSG